MAHNTPKTAGGQESDEDLTPLHPSPARRGGTDTPPSLAGKGVGGLGALSWADAHAAAGATVDENGTRTTRMLSGFVCVVRVVRVPFPRQVIMMTSEDRLINAARVGDLAAFNELVLIYQGLAFSVAYGILGNGDAAGDAIQDGFLKAYRSLDKFRGGSFKAWLMRIVANTCLDQLRARRRRQTTSFEELLDPEQAPCLIDRGRGPEEHAVNQELRRAIQLGMRALPVDQRAVIVLSDVEGCSYEEIAQATGMALGTVKSRLSRARAKMRDYLVRQPDLLPKRYTDPGGGATVRQAQAPLAAMTVTERRCGIA